VLVSLSVASQHFVQISIRSFGSVHEGRVGQHYSSGCNFVDCRCHIRSRHAFKMASALLTESTPLLFLLLLLPFLYMSDTGIVAEFVHRDGTVLGVRVSERFG
jgi:hypothetical protein